ncbi:MAG: hypothetical protein M1820_000117 [Bogoriella megaspora]|nr:MAG: hypothetical protein M1820_000117 [Bogoriella megaspora]
MAGKRLVDAARLFNATRGIAKQHIALRSQQLDIYNKTSTLAKAFRNQTDRITITVQAATTLLTRLNENGPSYTSTFSQSQATQREQPIPRHDSVRERRGQNDTREGLEQDHHYKQQEGNTTIDPVPGDELPVKQEKPARFPQQDGSIPPEGAHLEDAPSKAGGDTFAGRGTPEPAKHPATTETDALHPVESGASTIPEPTVTDRRPGAGLTPDDAKKLQRASESQIPSIATGSQPEPTTSRDQEVFHDRPRGASPELSSLPRTKLPKHTVDTQGSIENVQDGQINQDVYYSSEGERATQQIPSQEAVPEQEEIPEGVNIDVFHSPKISRMLGGKPAGKGHLGLGMKAASRTPIDKSSQVEGRDQDTFNVRTSRSQVRETTPKEAEETPELSIEHPDEDVKDIAAAVARDAESTPDVTPENQTEALSKSDRTPYQMRESRVPSSRFGRIWQYSGLATSMAFGAVGESWRRVTGSGVAGGSLMLSEANIERLVAKLSRMRGAALKLGQMMSFQDSKILPEPINQILQRVQDNADYMPPSQRDRVLSSNLGSEWRELFSSFDAQPIAAASIGQVHKATLKSTKSPVAVKVQYPGVVSSISSDLSNLSLLLTASRLLPKGLFLDKTIANARIELAWECDYKREADCASKFARLLSSPSDTNIFTVPTIHTEASDAQVLTADFMSGTAVTKLVPSLTQEQRDWIGTQILRLCLRELCDFAFMQTDPNWTNFLFNRSTQKLELLDFGATRPFPQKFIAPYIRTLRAASRGERERVKDLSIELGYLTGYESKKMADAHVSSVMTLAEPFMENAPDVYDFRDQTVTDRVRSFIPVMLKERLAPPPEETYSLHRKLSGAFLLLARLGSRVECRKMFEEAVGGWEARGGRPTPEAEEIVGRGGKSAQE